MYGQVYSVDATYKTNRYRLPLVLFTARDGNNRLFIAAVAIIYCETTSGYDWVLRQFQVALGPAIASKCEVVISDLDFAFESALASQWPDVGHQICHWHINRNVVRKIRPSIVAVFQDFWNILNDLKFAETEDVYEGAWASMLALVPPEVRQFMETYHSRRQKWSFAWTGSSFNCGIRTSQASESMNARVKKSLSASVDLLRLGMHLDKVGIYNNLFLKHLC